MGSDGRAEAANEALVYANAYIDTLTPDQALCVSRLLCSAVQRSLAQAVNEHAGDAATMTGTTVTAQLAITTVNRLIHASVGSTIDHPDNSCSCGPHATFLSEKINEATLAITGGDRG